MKHFPFAPEFIDVITVNDRPSQVTLKKRVQRVQEITNLWRIDDGWWRKPVARLYYSLELESGARITVFRDLIGGEWYRQNWTA
jgi:hypothetical protein